MITVCLGIYNVSNVSNKSRVGTKSSPKYIVENKAISLTLKSERFNTGSEFDPIGESSMIVLALTKSFSVTILSSAEILTIALFLICSSDSSSVPLYAGAEFISEYCTISVIPARVVLYILSPVLIEPEIALPSAPSVN